MKPWEPKEEVWKKAWSCSIAHSCATVAKRAHGKPPQHAWPWSQAWPPMCRGTGVRTLFLRLKSNFLEVLRITFVYFFESTLERFF